MRAQPIRPRNHWMGGSKRRFTDVCNQWHISCKYCRWGAPRASGRWRGSLTSDSSLLSTTTRGCTGKHRPRRDPRGAKCSRTNGTTVSGPVFSGTPSQFFEVFNLETFEMKTLQKGFTLIELMIVVAIIG